jgi:hypothetical protein
MAQESLQTPSESKTGSVQINGQPVIGADGQPQRTPQGPVKRDIILENGATYKIRMTETKNPDGTVKKYPEITKVTDPNSIPANASFLNTDCEGKAAERGLEGTDLKLEPMAGQATKNEETSYQLTAQTIAASAREHHIPDALLAAILSLEQKYSFPQQADPQHTWFTNPSGSSEAIERAATKIQQFYKSEDQTALRETIAKYYSESEKAPDAFVNEGMQAYQKWNSFKPTPK